MWHYGRQNRSLVKLAPSCGHSPIMFDVLLFRVNKTSSIQRNTFFLAVSVSPAPFLLWRVKVVWMRHNFHFTPHHTQEYHYVTNMTVASFMVEGKRPGCSWPKPMTIHRLLQTGVERDELFLRPLYWWETLRSLSFLGLGTLKDPINVQGLRPLLWM